MSRAVRATTLTPGMFRIYGHTRVEVPGRPSVWKDRELGRWCSLTWTTDARGVICVPQACSSHPTWESAMRRVGRWYYNGKTGTW